MTFLRVSGYKASCLALHYLKLLSGIGLVRRIPNGGGILRSGQSRCMQFPLGLGASFQVPLEEGKFFFSACNDVCDVRFPTQVLVGIHTEVGRVGDALEFNLVHRVGDGDVVLLLRPHTIPSGPFTHDEMERS